MNLRQKSAAKPLFRSHPELGVQKKRVRLVQIADGKQGDKNKEQLSNCPREVRVEFCNSLEPFMKIMLFDCIGCARYRIPGHADSPHMDAGELKPDPTSVAGVLTGQRASPIISARLTAG